MYMDEPWEGNQNQKKKKTKKFNMWGKKKGMEIFLCILFSWVCSICRG
jgi:hypothetical protein